MREGPCGNIGGPADPCALRPQVWTCSAKVVHDYHGYALGGEPMAGHQLGDAVKEAVQAHENCRIVGASLGSLDFVADEGQLPMAKDVDEMSAAARAHRSSYL